MPTFQEEHLNPLMPSNEEVPYTAQENEENRQECLHIVKYGIEICKQLCLSYYPDQGSKFAMRIRTIAKNHAVDECEDICLQIGVPTEAVCPLNAGCSGGCPCSDFLCSKTVFTNGLLLLDKTSAVTLKIMEDPFIRIVYRLGFLT
jgi:hypothetical protein